MPKVKVGDINMYYEIHGKGEPLVMIMGHGGSIEYFYKAIPVFSREYKLVVFDNRGAGRSDKPDIPYTTEIMADDLARLLEALKIESAHIHGASMGGMIAQQFVLHYPNSVRSLILACTYCGGTQGSLGMALDPEVMRAEAMDTLKRRQGLPLEKRMMETLRLCLSQEFMDKNAGLIKEMIKQMMKHPAPLHGQIRQMEAVMGHNACERLPEIKAPTLVIAGDADKLVPVENSRILASRIPGAKLVILKGMGHMFNLETEDESNRIILDFLRRHRSHR
jgi:pimeloyl-ACP methyl ester carboxylesterase